VCHRAKQNKSANDSHKALAGKLAVIALKYFEYFFHRPWPLYFLSGLLFLECTPLFLRLGFGCHLPTDALAFAILQPV
jgi:hypothetical protein